jgi:predicted phage terminase large subunit-like protein
LKDLPSLDLIRNETRRRRFAKPGGLVEFIQYFWDVLEPTTPFVDGWALRAICEHLEAVSAGKIRRLLINVPPGFAKSLIVNVFWPSWEWATLGSHLRYVSFSYSAHLTTRDNEKFRDLILSQKYQILYGHIFKLIKVGSEKVQSDKTGWKFASSVGGVGTGERGGRILADDLHNVREAESDAVREMTVQWFREAMQNRLNDLHRDAIIVIMQRVNEGDVSGIILEHYPEYVHLCIPMEFESDRVCTTPIGWTDPREYDGELAWPERYPEDVLKPFKNMPFLWAGQYMQRPEPRGGGIIKREYWKWWDAEAQRANDVKPGMYPNFDYIIASFDGAMGKKQENDWSALTVWGTWVETDEMQRTLEQFGTPSIMLVAAWRKKLTLHGRTDLAQMHGETKAEFEQRKKDNWGLVEHIADTCRKLKVNKLLIEAKANGHDIANEMQRLYAREDWVVVLDDPGQFDKTARVYSIQHFFADGRVWRPDTAWAEMVETEVAQFPKGAHDDLVDSMTAALRHLRRMGLLVRAEENSAAVEELQFPSAPRKSIIRYEA